MGPFPGKYCEKGVKDNKERREKTGERMGRGNDRKGKERYEGENEDGIKILH